MKRHENLYQQVCAFENLLAAAYRARRGKRFRPDVVAFQHRLEQVMPTRCGVEFLGWLVYPDHRRIRRATGVRCQRRLRALQQKYTDGLVCCQRG